MNALLDGLLPNLFKQSPGQQLQQDLHAVLTDAEALLLATADQSGEKIADIRQQVSHSIDRVKTYLQAEEAALIAQSKVAIKATDGYVHAHPWQSVASAAILGFALGWLSKR